MRILFNDIARNASVTSLYETAAYPASNIVDVFLDTLYLSVLPSDVITVDLLSDQCVDSIFIAGCNASSVGVEISSHTGTVLYSGTVAITRDIETLYIQEVTARYVKLTVDVTGDASYVKIKGFGCGCSVVYNDIQSDYLPTLTNETTYTRSKTGQVLRNKTPSFRSWEVTIPELNRDDLNTIDTNLTTLGIHYPTYFDMAEDASDYEQPIYGELSDVHKIEKRGKMYYVTIPILECR